MIRFVCKFEDEGPSGISFDTNGPPKDRVTVVIEDQIPVLYVNQSGCRVLAGIFAKLALGSYKAGFHLHLAKDFDSETETIRINLTD